MIDIKEIPNLSWRNRKRELVNSLEKILDTSCLKVRKILSDTIEIVNYSVIITYDITTEKCYIRGKSERGNYNVELDKLIEAQEALRNWGYEIKKVFNK